jgi:peptidoglycan/LPS O-acetylase OafA/YrhL
VPARSLPDVGLAGVRPSTGRRLPGIEGLRALAAGSVLVFHAWALTPRSGGDDVLGPLDRFMPDLTFGVVLFFTLSGFLLYRPFAAALVRAEAMPSIRRYFRNRALRILPAYWAILFLCLILGSLLFWDSAGRLVSGRPIDARVLAQSALFLQDYTPSTMLSGIGPAWSLAVEVVFYCLLPLLVLGAALLARRRTTRRGRTWCALAPAALLLVVGLSGKAAAKFLIPPAFPYAGYEQDWHSVLERSFWCQADLFAFGMIVAVVKVQWDDGRVRLPRWWQSAAVAAAIGSYLFTTARFRFEQLSYSPANTLMAAAFGLLLALVVLQRSPAQPSRLTRILETRALVGIGVISYSVFLWHEPLIRWLGAQGVLRPGAGGFATNLALVVAVTLAASTATYVFVEAPALRLRFRGRRREEAPVPSYQAEAAP